MRTNPRISRQMAPTPAFLIAVATVFALPGCDNDGGASIFAPPLPTVVTGTVATGKPLAGAEVWLKDSAGKAASAMTASDGTFSIKTIGLTPPYLLKVTGASGNLYSVSDDDKASTTINVTTVTDLVARTWFTLNGTGSLDSAFQNPSGITWPKPSQIDSVEQFMNGVLALWLKESGVDPAKSHPISTPFQADGRGVDHVLDMMTVHGSVITITGTVATAATAKPASGSLPPNAPSETRTQTTVLTYDTGAKTVTAESTVTMGDAKSETQVTSVVPTTSAADTAIADISATLKAMADVANSKGQSIQAEDLLPYLDPQTLAEGINQQELAALMAAQLRNTTTTQGAFLVRLDQLDTTNGTARGVVGWSETQGDQTSANYLETRFRLVNGKWLYGGDGYPCDIDVGVSNDSEVSGADMASGITLSATADCRKGAYTRVTVSGGPWLDQELPVGGILVNEIDIESETRGLWIDGAGIVPAAGTAFTFKLYAPDGSTSEYQKRANGIVDGATIVFNSDIGTSAAAIIGTTVTQTWYLPPIFVIDRLRFGASIATGPYGNPATVECDVYGPPVSPTSTGASIAIPATCDGLPVTNLSISIRAFGINGEVTGSRYVFH